MDQLTLSLSQIRLRRTRVRAKIDGEYRTGTVIDFVHVDVDDDARFGIKVLFDDSTEMEFSSDLAIHQLNVTDLYGENSLIPDVAKLAEG